MTEQNWSGSEQQDWSVQTKKPELVRIEPGEYGGVVSRLEKIGTSYGEAAKWYFAPDGMDVEVTAITSIAAGNLAKPAE